MIRYVGLFRCLQDDHWQVTFPDLPGCLARGETFQEAYESARDALADELIAADGPPRPRTTLEIILDARKDPALGRALVWARSCILFRSRIRAIPLPRCREIWARRRYAMR